MLKRANGFTLVELMVVVLVMGILVAIAVPVFNSARGRAEEKTCFANQRLLEGVYQEYASSNDWTPTTVYSSFFVDQGYLKKAPQCPAWSRDTTYTQQPARYYFPASYKGEVWTVRYAAGDVGDWKRGCPVNLARHGYYRTPEVN